MKPINFLVISLTFVSIFVWYSYNLFTLVPEQHAWVMQKNLELQLKLNNRIIENIQNVQQTPIIPPSLNEDKNMIAILNDSLEICQGLLSSLRKADGNATKLPVIPTPAPVPMVTIPTPIQAVKIANTDTGVLPVLVLCYNRPDYLVRTLNNLLEVRGSNTQFPIIVSEDGTNQEVWDLLNGEKYFDKIVSIQYKNRGKWPTAYHYISQHFKFAIGSVLDKLQYSSVIILEDDMNVSPDFFEYFLAMRELVTNDKSLYTASAWNDNGQNDNGRDPALLKRSDFFPGLGWLMTKDLWNELKGKWPDGYWDDWIRDKNQRKGRHVIFPEISRTFTFGEAGSSAGQFYSTYLKPITLYNGPVVPFTTMNFTYLEDANWFSYIRSKLASAVVISGPKQVSSSAHSKVIIVYTNDNQYASIAKELGIMYDEKDGIHRCAYKGVVYFWRGNKEVILADANYKKTFSLN